MRRRVIFMVLAAVFVASQLSYAGVINSYVTNLGNAERWSHHDSYSRSDWTDPLDDPAPRAIEDTHPALALRQGGPVDHVAGVVRERHVDRDVVGLREELVQGHRVDLHPLGAARRQVGVERHDPHPEGLGPAGDLAAYPAEPDHPEGLPEELDARERLPVPLSVAHGGGGLGHGTCTAEKVREGELGRRD